MIYWLQRLIVRWSRYRFMPTCVRCGLRHTDDCWIFPCEECGGVHTGDPIALESVCCPKRHSKLKCMRCRSHPDAKERVRIEADDWESAIGWYCPVCEPDLLLAKSGLCFDVVDVGGSSPEHEYE